MKKALICVDLQKDFVENGALAVKGGQAVAQAVAHLIIPVYQRALPDTLILFTKDFHIDPGDHFSETPDFVDSWPRHCVAGTEGAEFAEDFGSAVEERIFRKGAYSAAYSGAEGVNIDGVSLVDYLHEYEVEGVEILGIAFDYCVKSTAIDLAKEGFDTAVIGFFTASVHPENDDKTIEELRDSGVRVLVTEEFGGTYA